MNHFGEPFKIRLDKLRETFVRNQRGMLRTNIGIRQEQINPFPACRVRTSEVFHIKLGEMIR
jgi:hypothetical protein